MSYFSNSRCNLAIAKIVKKTPNFVEIPHFQGHTLSDKCGRHVTVWLWAITIL